MEGLNLEAHDQLRQVVCVKDDADNHPVGPARVEIFTVSQNNIKHHFLLKTRERQ